MIYIKAFSGVEEFAEGCTNEKGTTLWYRPAVAYTLLLLLFCFSLDILRHT